MLTKEEAGQKFLRENPNTRILTYRDFNNKFIFAVASTKNPKLIKNLASVDQNTGAIKLFNPVVDGGPEFRSTPVRDYVTDEIGGTRRGNEIHGR